MYGDGVFGDGFGDGFGDSKKPRIIN